MTLQQVGRYEIQGEIGRGGMAVVYDAYDPKIDRRVALKVLPDVFKHDRNFAERFMLEAKAAATLEHKAIVPVYDYGEVDDKLFIAMRYLAGGTLAERIDDPHRQLTLSQIADVIERIAPAVDFAHNHKMLHRDIKPGNILFDEEGRAYLADFGLVKMLEGSQDLTGSGVVGTPEYLAPEMAQGQQLTSMVDIYALGTLLFEAVTGEPPYDADTPTGILVAHVTEPVPDPRDRNPDLPRSLSPVIMRALAKSPENRFKDAQTLAKEFRAAVEGRRLSFKPVDYNENTRRLPREGVGDSVIEKPRQRRSALPTLIGITVLAIIILSAIYLLNRLGQGGESPSGLSTEAVQDSPTEASEANTPAPTPTDRPPSTAIPAQPQAQGGAIVFQTNRDGDDDLWLLSLDTLDITPLLETDVTGETLPVWSPDGSQIAFVSNESGKDDIFVMDADGGNVRQLTNHSAVDTAPTWSPDGSQIAFASDRDGDWDIYIMNADGSDQQAVIDSPYDDLSPSWSPDGALIAFQSRRVGNIDIYVMTVGGILRGAVTTDLSDDLTPRWSPDGSTIAFTSPRDGDWDIFLIDADGGNERKLTANTAYDSAPAWSPDGEWVLFSSGQLGRVSLHRIHPDGTGEEELIPPGDYYFDAGAWRP